MPYSLSVSRSFTVQKPVQVNITRVRIVEYSLSVEDPLNSSISVELLSGSGPYVAETTIAYLFNQDSTARILAASPAGNARVSLAIEKAIFDELARLGVIPTGTVV